MALSVKVRVRIYGLRIIVNHDCLVASLAKGANSTDRAPVQLDGGTDAVDTGAEDHHAVVLERDIALRSVVGEVEVVGEGRELGSDSVDLLHEGHDTGVFAHLADTDLV